MTLEGLSSDGGRSRDVAASRVLVPRCSQSGSECTTTKTARCSRVIPERVLGVAQSSEGDDRVGAFPKLPLILAFDDAGSPFSME
jgi:hypothetical protein